MRSHPACMKLGDKFIDYKIICKGFTTFNFMIHFMQEINKGPVLYS